MQYSLFDEDVLEVALDQDSRLYRGEYFAITSNKTVFINKRDGVVVATKCLDAFGHLNEEYQPVARFPVLPIEVHRWDENQFYVRLVYSNKKSLPIEKVVSLDALRQKGMRELRRVLMEDGVTLNTLEATALGKVLVEVLRVGTANGSIPMRNKVSRRDWIIQGICMVPRASVAPLTLVHS